MIDLPRGPSSRPVGAAGTSAGTEPGSSRARMPAHTCISGLVCRSRATMNGGAWRPARIALPPKALSPAALKIAAQPTVPAYSPIVLAGAVRLIELAITVLVSPCRGVVATGCLAGGVPFAAVRHIQKDLAHFVGSESKKVGQRRRLGLVQGADQPQPGLVHDAIHAMPPF